MAFVFGEDVTLSDELLRLETDASLLEPEALRRRLDALDLLDCVFDDARADALREQLEAANAAVYESIRAEVERGGPPVQLRRWLAALGSTEMVAGLGYDRLDELVSGVLQLAEPEGDVVPGAEMVFYQPTPVRHVLDLVEKSGLSAADTLVDVGSGLGHVPLLVSVLSGARCVGVELEAAYVASARECAERLGLERVSFVQQDARVADFSVGTVFYLYTPFAGAMLRLVLDRLCEAGAAKVCTLGPCAEVVARETWLRACGPVDTECVSVFERVVPSPYLGT